MNRETSLRNSNSLFRKKYPQRCWISHAGECNYYNWIWIYSYKLTARQKQRCGVRLMLPKPWGFCVSHRGWFFSMSPLHIQQVGRQIEVDLPLILCVASKNLCKYTGSCTIILFLSIVSAFRPCFYSWKNIHCTLENSIKVAVKRTQISKPSWVCNKNPSQKYMYSHNFSKHDKAEQNANFPVNQNNFISNFLQWNIFSGTNDTPIAANTTRHNSTQTFFWNQNNIGISSFLQNFVCKSDKIYKNSHFSRQTWNQKSMSSEQHKISKLQVKLSLNILHQNDLEWTKATQHNTSISTEQRERLSPPCACKLEKKTMVGKNPFFFRRSPRPRVARMEAAQTKSWISQTTQQVRPNSKSHSKHVWSCLKIPRIANATTAHPQKKQHYSITQRQVGGIFMWP